MRQMLTIADTTAQVEQRLVEAKAEREEYDEDNFARRVSLLIESLNSAAIDVAKLLSNEVTDIAWAGYLKGDRGVFTRRAVRLLDSGDARAIAQALRHRRRLPRAGQPLHPRFRGDAARACWRSATARRSA